MRIRFYFKKGLRHDIHITYGSFREKVMPGFIFSIDNCSFSGPELDHLIERLEANSYLIKVYKPKPILAIIKHCT